MRTAPHSATPDGVGPLSGLFCQPRPAEETVAFNRGGRRSRGELEARVAALSRSLGGGRWLLLCDDAFDAAAGLLALARCGGVAVLPPNRQSETLRRLAGDARGALCGKSAAGELPRGLRSVAVDAAPGTAPLEPEPLVRDVPWIELHTSGTTGEPRRSLKCLAHLEDEVAALERLLGPRLPTNARVFATAPPHHIYGLLFRVLWPLASGRPFQAETPLHVREIAARMSGAGPCALVTTPVHLRHLRAGQGLSELRGSCRAVFSSGGPLDAASAAAVAEQLGEAPLEILGSTETGGVALRQRPPDGDWWSPFPEVAVDRDPGDGALVVTSTFVSEGTALGDGRRRFRMGDCIELAPDGRFRLLGRVDRSVKIGGLRLSLPAMESALESHPWVEEAALLVLTRGAGPRVASAVVLSPAGREALERDGRRACGRALAAHLAAGFDPVLLPRTWRYVDALPRNAQGKLPRDAVEALFGEVLHVERHFKVDPELACLDGHFPGHPIVPGVAQLGWALETAAELLGREPRPRAVEALKFPTPLRPGDVATLRVELSADAGSLRFSLHDAGRTFATGRVLLGGRLESRPTRSVHSESVQRAGHRAESAEPGAETSLQRARGLAGLADEDPV